MISNTGISLPDAPSAGFQEIAGSGPPGKRRGGRPLQSKAFRPHDYSVYRGVYPYFQDVIDHLEGLPAKKFLDVGCATGELLEMIHRQRKGATLYGLDQSERTVSLARKNLASRADIMTWDARTIPLENNQVDVVVSSKSFHYPNPLDILAEIRRVLNHCGRLIIPAYKLPWPVCTLANAMIGHSTDGRVKLYSKNQILDLLDEAGFLFEKWTDIGNYGFVVSAMVVKPEP